MSLLLAPPLALLNPQHPLTPPSSLISSTTNRFERRVYNWKTLRYSSVYCRFSRVKEPPSANPDSLIREPHKYFDHAVIIVRSGDGGHGAVLSLPSEGNASKSRGKNDKDSMKKKGSYKRESDGSLILPMGGHGGDVVIYADESKDSLLELHQKSRHNAKRGGNVDAMGTLTSQLHDGFAAPTLRIPVPVGTVVKRKRGTFLADLARPGDEVLVARGGQGGISLIEMPEHRQKRMMALSTNVMRDKSDKVLVFGQPGEEVSLELILRVVADVGLVGLPNAGKSTLLSAVTLAKPDIADYPFTTLMPNLGRLDGDPTLGALRYSSEATLADLPGLIEGAHLGKGLGRNFLRHLRRTRLLVHVVDASSENPVHDYLTVKEINFSTSPRRFSMHIIFPRLSAKTFSLMKFKVMDSHLEITSLYFPISSGRTSMTPWFVGAAGGYSIVPIDASGDVADVDAVLSSALLLLGTREKELRMYNPEYLQRPYVVVLNKIDLPKAEERLPFLVKDISSIGCSEVSDMEMSQSSPAGTNENNLGTLGYNEDELKEKNVEDYPRPLAVVGASVLKNIGVDEMLKEIRAALRKCRDLESADESGIRQTTVSYR